MKPLPLDGFLDIECGNWTRFRVGGVLDKHGFSYSTDPDQFWHQLSSCQGSYWAHFGGRYDHLWVLEECNRRRIKAQPSLSGSSVSYIRIGRLELRDSWSLLRMSLDEAAMIAGLRKSVFPLPCRCGNCEPDLGYCRLNDDLSMDELRQVVEYLRSDLVVLSRTLHTFRELALANDITLKGTIAGTAWATAQAWCGIPDADWQGKWREYKFARKGYYGGRQEIYSLQATHGARADISAAYPSVYLASLPVGAPEMVEDDSARRLYHSGVGGFYEASVSVGDSDIPPLPVHVARRSAYPLGVFRSVWTLPELAHAEQHGVGIGRIHRALVYPRTERILAPYAERLDQLKQRSTPAFVRWLKLLLNSLSGCMARRANRQLVFLSDEPPRGCPADGKCHGVLCRSMCCLHNCTKACGRWDQVGPSGTIWSRDIWHVGPWSHSGMAAYIPAIIRTRVLDALAKTTEPWQVATDCVMGDELAFPKGNAMGEWRDEGKASRWEARGIGVYRYKDDRGVSVCALKGIPRAHEGWRIIEGGGTEFEDHAGVIPFLSAARTGLGLFRRRVQRYTFPHLQWIGSRRVVGDKTRPATLQEFRFAKA